MKTEDEIITYLEDVYPTTDNRTIAEDIVRWVRDELLVFEDLKNTIEGDIATIEIQRSELLDDLDVKSLFDDTNSLINLIDERMEAL